MRLAILLFATALSNALASDIIQSAAHRFSVETIASNLDHPWAVAKLPDGRFIVTERGGTLQLIDPQTGAKQSVEGVPPVWAQGQGGLLDIHLHPRYPENGWIYITFSKPIGENALTSVVRARLKDKALVDLETIFEPPADQATSRKAHFGSRLAFDGRGHLFFSIGDRGGPTNPKNLAQSLASVTGKIHRLHDDGRVPDDNPFVNTPDAIPSIWAYGVRNPQGLVYDAANGRLWETEHGPRGGDELNIIRPGANYGWPVATYGINYNGTVISDKTSLSGMQDPVIQWTPVIAASGLELYRGDKFPRWNGNLFAGGLAGKKLVRMELSGTAVAKQEVLLADTGRIRDVRVFDDGFLYIVYDEPGQLVRLVPAE